MAWDSLSVDMNFDGLSYRRTADELVANAESKKYWLSNAMDSENPLSAGGLSIPGADGAGGHNALEPTAGTGGKSPAEIKPDGLRSYRKALPQAFPTRPVKHIVSKGIRQQGLSMEKIKDTPE